LRSPIASALGRGFRARHALALSKEGFPDTPPQRTVVQETRYIAPARQTVVTTLPPNYRVRAYRGQTYYVYDNVYYRAHPGGYVVVGRPW
jgi:hypothetical protein